MTNERGAWSGVFWCFSLSTKPPTLRPGGDFDSLGVSVAPDAGLRTERI